MNFWQGKLVRLRGVEPSDAEAFARWNLDSEAARELDFTWPPVSLARITKDTEELALRKFEADEFFFIIEGGAGVAVGSINTRPCNRRAETEFAREQKEGDERQNGSERGEESEPEERVAADADPDF